MSIKEQLLEREENSAVLIAPEERVSSLYERLAQVGAANWWLLVLYHARFGWLVTDVSQFYALLAEQGAASLDYGVSHLPLDWRPVAYVEQDTLNTRAAEARAAAEPYRILIVTKDGAFVGLINKARHRGAASSVKRPELEAAKVDETATDTSDVRFSAYYAREVQADERQTIHVYAHLDSMAEAIAEDAERFQDDAPRRRQSKETAQIKLHAKVTIHLEGEGLEFEPEELTKRWRGDWLRYSFDFYAPASLIDESVMVEAIVSVEGVEISSLRWSIDVVASEETAPDSVAASKAEETPAPPQEENPLAAAKAQHAHVQSKVYQSIFISYSRRDVEVVRAYYNAQIALGNQVFMDTVDIRTGSDWQASLAEAIDKADIMQLFWSKNSAQSDNVRDEWTYALQERCAETQCRGFIRPVFWQKPMPDVPQTLGHLNFRFVQFADDA